MNVQKFISLFSLYFALATCCLAQEDNSSSKPNVLFLICDDLNCDMGMYGHPLVTEWGETGSQGKELYGHKNEPEELNNLANDPKQAELISSLAEKLHTKIAENRHPPIGLVQIPIGKRMNPPISTKFAPK